MTTDYDSWSFGFGYAYCPHAKPVARSAPDFDPNLPPRIVHVFPWPCDVCTPEQLREVLAPALDPAGQDTDGGD